MKYDIFDLAKYIITRGVDSNYSITLNKLQFILYLSQVKYLRVFKEPLFEEIIYLNKYAFIIDKVYDRFCGFGGMEILLSFPEVEPKIELHIRLILDYILEKYGKLNLIKDNLLNRCKLYKIYASFLNFQNKRALSIEEMENLETIKI